MRRSVELTFSERYRRENPEMMQLILDATLSGSVGATPIGVTGTEAPAGFIGQVTAVMLWMGAGGSAARLEQIVAPTLVLHGTGDLLLPVGNGRLLARDIPGARYREWEGAGHALIQEEAEGVNQELGRHLAESIEPAASG
jgi:pimeloyl-ACP methyl ester carboxylesterase